MPNQMVEAQNEQIFQHVLPLLQQELGADLLGVLAAGSRVHGTPGPSSDLDMHVVLASSRTRRRIMLVDGVEVEQLFNPLALIHEYIKKNAVDCSMFALGLILYDPQGIMADLKAEAKVLWALGPAMIPTQEIWQHRYLPSDLLGDLSDVDEADEATIALIVAQICSQLLETHYRLHQHWKPKAKRCLNDLAQWDVLATQLARNALACTSLAERRAALVSLSEHILAPLGGPMPLEWSIPWENLS
jgi:hypothetical protein